MGVISYLAKKVNPSPSQIKAAQESPVGTPWPPEGHGERIRNYETFEEIFDGNHEEAFAADGLSSDDPVYIACNLASIIVKVPADLLFGEPLAFNWPKEVSEEQQNRVRAIWDRNEMQQMLYEMAIDSAYYGDGVFAVGRSGKDKEGKGGEAIIRPVQPTTWFPKLNPDDTREVIMHRIAWRRMSSDGKDEFLRTMDHFPGHYFNRLFYMKGGTIQREATDAEWADLYDEVPEERVETGLSDFAIVHLPNFRTSRMYYGRSDFMGIESMFAALNDRVSQSNVILDRHADPKMSAPGELFESLTQGGRVDRARLEETHIFRQGENGESAQYLTWDGKLDDNHKLIAELTEKILMVSEIDRQLVGLGNFGEISGRALKILLMRTLSKVARRQRYCEPAIMKLLALAQEIEKAEPVLPALQWPDGLPNDVIEDVEIETAKVQAGFTTRVRSIMRLENVDEEEAQAIKEERDAEESEESAPTPQVGARPRPPIQVSVGAE